jgi:hypothetical protein
MMDLTDISFADANCDLCVNTYIGVAASIKGTLVFLGP